MSREAKINRKTKETQIELSLCLDGTGEGKIDTGIGFFDHMLDLFTKHGLFDIEVKAVGDLEVDFHHTVEDVGIVLGKAFKKALQEKKAIKRYGCSYVPMDEALARAVVDISSRPFLVFEADFPSQKVGEMDIELVEEFFRAVAFNAGINAHIKVFYGNNSHHMAEAAFKAFARALDEATFIDNRIKGVMSTKGVL